ncbi:cell division protein FtsL [Halomonas endophytica]|uniref:Cell division protein FtsL n=1 Tax=Billgrantia endophytica TaxID=2033802 RepID=A0A2N7U8Z4_9GAMM|nr:cell division protein FtsL [Halomonas endophytica]
MNQGRHTSSSSSLGWPFGRMPSTRLIIVCALVLACLASATAVINATHLTREQYARLQQLERERDQLQTEWGQLLLEESAWSSPARIERLAVDRLEMRLPDVNEVEVIRP